MAGHSATGDHGNDNPVARHGGGRRAAPGEPRCQHHTRCQTAGRTPHGRKQQRLSQVGQRGILHLEQQGQGHGNAQSQQDGKRPQSCPHGQAQSRAQRIGIKRLQRGQAG